MAEKICVKIIKNGEPFNAPEWTLQDQIDHDEFMHDYGEKNNLKPTDKTYSRIFNEQLVLRQLKKIKNELTVNDVRQIHPGDFIELANTLYESGRRRVRPDENFQKTKKQ